MRLQQRLYYGAHVRVGCVNFVYHQQAARQAGGAHVRVANLKRRHHRLIHRADRHLRRQIPLGTLRRPAPPVVESVFPPYPIIGQMPPVEVARADVSRNRQDGERRGVAVRHHAFHEFRDPAMNLNGGGARGQGEVERIHALTFVKTPRNATAPPPSCRSRFRIRLWRGAYRAECRAPRAASRSARIPEYGRICAPNPKSRRMSRRGLPADSLYPSLSLSAPRERWGGAVFSK